MLADRVAATIQNALTCNTSVASAPGERMNRSFECRSMPSLGCKYKNDSAAERPIRIPSSIIHRSNGIHLVLGVQLATVIQSEGYFISSRWVLSGTRSNKDGT